jgi:hypothetical protein
MQLFHAAVSPIVNFLKWVCDRNVSFCRPFDRSRSDPRWIARKSKTRKTTMKKIYLATAALVLFAGTAAAQEYPRSRDTIHPRRPAATRVEPGYYPGYWAPTTTTGMGMATGTEAGNNADSLYGSNSAVGQNPDTVEGQTSGSGASGSAGGGQ